MTKYQKRISGPLLGRIDIHIEVPRVDYEKLSGGRVGESSETIRARIQAVRDRQTARYVNSDSKHVVSNEDMRVKEIREYCKLDEQSQIVMRSAMTQLQLSARAYHRMHKLARTIADLGGSDDIQPTHLAEALQYRPKIMMGIKKTPCKASF